MKKTTLIASALVALGVISQASAASTNFVYITGSTAFRGNVFNALSVGTDTKAGAIFDHAPTILPSTAGSGSGQIVYVGTIGGTNYTIDCSWTGSEAGIADVEGLPSLFDAKVPNTALGTNYNLPGIPTIFLNPVTGAAGTNATQPDLAFADTSQAVSITKPPANPALVDYGCVGIVPFTWMKGKNTTPTASWTDLTNISQAQVYYALGSQVTASFLTGNVSDTDPVYIVGRNRGSGTHANTFLDAEYYGVATPASQYAFNSGYQGGVLTYITNGGTYFPNITIGAPLGLISVANDGYDSGAFVSDVMSCDIHGAHALVIGYAGISDGKHARDGQGDKSGAGLANQPNGAVWLTFDGFGFTDGNVINGPYSYWGHEHLLGQNGQSSSSAAGIIAGLLPAAINSVGGLGDGTSPNNQDTGIQAGVMNVDKPGSGGIPGAGGDSGYPSQL